MFVINWLSCQLNLFKHFQIWQLLSCPVSHCLFISSTFIIDCWWVVLLSWFEEFNCWVTSDSKSWCDLLSLSCVHFCYFNFSFELSGQSCPFRSESLTMSAPWCIKLNKPCIFISINKFIEVISSQNNDIFLFSWSLRSFAWMITILIVWTSTTDSFWSNLS